MKKDYVIFLWKVIYYIKSASFWLIIWMEWHFAFEFCLLVHQDNLANVALVDINYILAFHWWRFQKFSELREKTIYGEILFLSSSTPASYHEQCGVPAGKKKTELLICHLNHLMFRQFSATRLYGEQVGIQRQEKLWK